MNAENILILTAVQMETRAMRRALAGRGCRFHTVGIGAKRLPEREKLIGVSTILMCGVAGALDRSLRIGDVVLDETEIQTLVMRYSEEPDSSTHYSTLLSTSVPASVRRGAIYTAKEIISNPSQKSELFLRTGALAVDMEQAIVREFAKPLQIPVIGLRAISDTANQILDPAVIHLVDDLGKARPLKIASFLIRRPDLIPYLKQLGANAKVAVNKLGEAAVEIVDKLTASKGT